MQPVATIAERCAPRAWRFTPTPFRRSASSRCAWTSSPCTLATISGHKIGAPKGIGALIVRDRKAIEAIIHGGGQQFGIRPGTENVAGAVALGRAASLAAAERRAEAERLRAPAGRPRSPAPGGRARTWWSTARAPSGRPTC